MKRKLFALFALILIPAFSMLGCGETQTFLITTTSSNENYGTASGGSLDEFDQNSKVTLKATELKADTNPFLCWVKDKSQVVSTEKEYEISVSAATAGEYSAVFQENDLRFAALYKISYVGQENYTNFSYSVSYTLANQSIVLCEGEQDQKEMSVFDGSVLYLPTGTNLDFDIQLSSAINYPVYHIENLNNATFDGQSSWTYTTVDGNFEIEFVKLNSALLGE